MLTCPPPPRHIPYLMMPLPLTQSVILGPHPYVTPTRTHHVMPSAPPVPHHQRCSPLPDSFTCLLAAWHMRISQIPAARAPNVRHFAANAHTPEGMCPAPLRVRARLRTVLRTLSPAVQNWQHKPGCPVVAQAPFYRNVSELWSAVQRKSGRGKQENNAKGHLQCVLQVSLCWLSAKCYP
mmetsp:Transcript_7056/g.10744  ORF Transcript_7056/g.10744 Transcript_7056/m.10744 type:complete len:180 (+) Transcript_7056:1361-1900(+)